MQIEINVGEFFCSRNKLARKIRPNNFHNKPSIITTLSSQSHIVVGYISTHWKTENMVEESDDLSYLHVNSKKAFNSFQSTHRISMVDKLNASIASVMFPLDLRRMIYYFVCVSNIFRSVGVECEEVPQRAVMKSVGLIKRKILRYLPSNWIPHFWRSW